MQFFPFGGPAADVTDESSAFGDDGFATARAAAARTAGAHNDSLMSEDILGALSPTASIARALPFLYGAGRDAHVLGGAGTAPSPAGPLTPFDEAPRARALSTDGNDGNESPDGTAGVADKDAARRPFVSTLNLDTLKRDLARAEGHSAARARELDGAAAVRAREHMTALIAISAASDAAPRGAELPTWAFDWLTTNGPASQRMAEALLTLPASFPSRLLSAARVAGLPAPATPAPTAVTAAPAPAADASLAGLFASVATDSDTSAAMSVADAHGLACLAPHCPHALLPAPALRPTGHSSPPRGTRVGRVGPGGGPVVGARRPAARVPGRPGSL